VVSGDRDVRLWAPRVLAPLAFFTAATILVLLVHSSLNADETGTSAPRAAQTETGGSPGTATGQPTTTRASGVQRKRFYQVRTGDTLEAIAARFNTTTADLLELNPDIDPLTLTPGQRIRIR
jgi:LysM repeat protein